MNIVEKKITGMKEMTRLFDDLISSKLYHNLF